MNRSTTIAGAFAAAAGLLAAADIAQAGCADPRAAGTAAIHTIPGFIVAGLAPKIALSAPGPAPVAQRVVGTWLVTYRSEGKPFAQALIQWHSDGTEWEDINLPIEGGNVCVGSWESVDTNSVKRFHIGWLYTAGLLTGYFTETETDKVIGSSYYSGVSDTKIFDLTGKVLVELSGTSNAVRVGP
jgi:hypothetical protein